MSWKFKHKPFEEEIPFWRTSCSGSFFFWERIFDIYLDKVLSFTKRNIYSKFNFLYLALLEVIIEKHSPNGSLTLILVEVKNNIP